MIQQLFEKLRGQGAASASAASGMRFVDLGLPSGTLWAEQDSEVSAVEGCSLPTYEQTQELIMFCEFYLETAPGGETRYRAQGPSGRSVFFPAKMYDGAPPEPSSCCWCGGSSDPEYGCFLLISEMTITIGVGMKELGYPYRMVRS